MDQSSVEIPEVIPKRSIHEKPSLRWTQQNSMIVQSSPSYEVNHLQNADKTGSPVWAWWFVKNLKYLIILADAIDSHHKNY